jgi:type I restriction enzyme S subunit
MDDWRIIRLGEVAEDLTVGYVGTMTNEYRPSGIPFLRSLNVEPFRISLTDLKFIDEAFSLRLKKSELRPGDVVIVRTGRPGACAVIPEWLPIANCSDLVIVRPGNKLDPRFLMYYINAMAADHVAAHLVGAVQQHFNVASARDISLRLPPLSEQQSIAHVLGTLDDKIELNRKMNETLEEIARTIFTSWFVNFDPVRAKAEGRQPEGMDAETAALFPDSFVDSELGEIPEGWRVQSLDSIAKFLNGLALQKFPSTENEWLPAIKIAQLRKGDTSGADRVGANVPAEYIVNDGNVLFSWSGSLEVEFWCGGVGALNQHLFKVTSDQYPKWFYFQWIRQHLDEFRSIAAGKATTMGHIQRGHLSAAKTVVPPPRFMERADSILSPMIDKLVLNRLESRTLAEIRDTLLPKLLSGELRVKDADRVLEEAIV